MPAKLAAMTLIDLLGDQARRGRELREAYVAPMTRAQYLEFVAGLAHDELWTPETSNAGTGTGEH